MSEIVAGIVLEVAFHHGRFREQWFSLVDIVCAVMSDTFFKIKFGLFRIRQRLFVYRIKDTEGVAGFPIIKQDVSVDEVGFCCEGACRVFF